MKKIVIALAAFLTALSANAEEKVISFNALPMAAQQFANANFAGKQMASAQMDTTLFGAIVEDYKVVYTDGTEIEFNDSGNWTKIKAKTSSIPADLVPEKIRQYVKANFNNSPIVVLERKSSGYKVELASKQELKFDPNFIFVGLD